MRLIGAGVSLLLLLAVGVGGFVLWLTHRADRPGPLPEAVVVEITSGMSHARIAKHLENLGVIDDARLFEMTVRMLGERGSIKAGEYGFPAHISARDMIDMLIEGSTLVHRLTIPEGLTSAEIVDRINNAPNLTGTVEVIPDEGSLLPETYYVSKGDDRAEIIVRMESALDQFIAERWSKRAQGLPFDTPRQALILASIVEKETSVSTERAHIAGVFVNRLRRGMRLQSDPTVIYGLTDGAGPLGRALTRADLERDHPYNTYRIDGLPPHPIANPGRAAIEAALNPRDTEDLYFVADGNGGHLFARTLDDHNRNVAKWRRIRDSVNSE